MEGRSTFLLWDVPVAGVIQSENRSALAAECWVASEDDLRRVLDDAEEARCDELVLVPGTVELACLDAFRRGRR